MSVRLILGCGYVGLEAAKTWLQTGDSVAAVTRSANRASELKSLGIQPIVWDWLSDTLPTREASGMLANHALRGEPITILSSVSHAINPAVPPNNDHAVGLGNAGRFLELLGLFENSRWIYLSTTGVYGSAKHGEWIDEETPPKPDRAGSINAYSGEQWLEAHLPGKSIVLRPAGIYGPGRIPKWQTIRDRETLLIDPNSYLNLIHVADLAAILVEVSNRRMKHRVYCVCDPHPTLRYEYYSEIARIGNWPEPVFAKQSTEQKDEPKRSEASNRAESVAVPPAHATGYNGIESGPLGKDERKGSLVRQARSDGNKRISSRRIQEELAYQFIYPSYREGLQELLPRLL
jgi:nucleoside-diphosphate-sugar epimerase